MLQERCAAAACCFTGPAAAAQVHGPQGTPMDEVLKVHFPGNSHSDTHGTAMMQAIREPHPKNAELVKVSCTLEPVPISRLHTRSVGLRTQASQSSLPFC